MSDRVHGRVADLGDVLLAAGHLPHLLPQAFDLELVKGPSRVPSDGDVAIAEIGRRVESQDLWHLVGVGVEELLV